MAGVGGLYSASLDAASSGAFTADDKSALPGGASGPVSVLRIPHWEESPELYERVIIAGVQLPGTATVSGEGYKRRTDKKKTPGQHGETTTDMGQESVEIEVTVDLWTPQHLADFHAITKRVLAPRMKVVKETKQAPYFVGYTGADATSNVVPATFSQPVTTTKTVNAGDGPGPVSIYYPTLALFGITKVQVLAIGLPTKKSGDVWTARLKCRQYIANKTAKVTTNEKAADSFAKRLGGNAFTFDANSPSKTTTGPTYVPPSPSQTPSPPPPRHYPVNNYRVLDKW